MTRRKSLPQVNRSAQEMTRSATERHKTHRTPAADRGRSHGVAAAGSPQLELLGNVGSSHPDGSFERTFKTTVVGSWFQGALSLLRGCASRP